MNRRTSNRLFSYSSQLLLAIGISLLIACSGGGGGGKKKPTPEPTDTIPGTYSFSPLSGVSRDALVSSETVRVSGFNTATTISVTNGEYSINGGEFVSTQGSISPNQTVTVRVTTNSGFDETEVAELNVGGVKATFSVTTEVRDVTPKSFTFDPVTEADLDSVHTTDPITVEEINDGATITITNGSYSINNGDFIATAGTVTLDDTVKIRGTASSETDKTVNVTLTIGDLSAEYRIETISDKTAPTAQIAFPPPISITANNSLMVRGTTEDDYNGIKSVKVYVNGSDSGSEITLDTTSTSATWSTQLNLIEGDNIIDIVVTDSKDNIDVKAASVKVVNGDIDNAFPDEDVSFNGSQDLIVYKSGTGYVALTSNYDEDSIFYLTDLSTGKRTVQNVTSVPVGLENFTSLVHDDEANEIYLTTYNPDGGPQGFLKVDMSTWSVTTHKELPEDVGYSIIGLAYDPSQTDGRFLFGTISENIVGQIDAEFDSYSVFSSNDTPNAENPYNMPWELVTHPISNEIYVMNLMAPNLYKLDPETGARTLISGEGNVVDEVSSWERNHAMTVDVNNDRNRLLLVGQDQNAILAVDIGTGARSLFSLNDTVMPFENLGGITTDPNLGYVLAQDTALKAIFAIDLETGQRVIVTKSN